MNDSAKETGDLIAVHNLSGEKLANALALSGFSMLFIAIMKALQRHGRYGEISVLLNKDTVDPQFIASNLDNLV